MVRWLAIALLVVAAPPRRRGKSGLQPGTLEHFAEFCRRFIVLDTGLALELERFQRWILAGYFAGVTEILVLLPKKNGKTTLLAALALYHLIYTHDAHCYIAASAKDQAKILYDQATGFVERKDPKTKQLLPQARALQKRVLLRKGTKEIRSRRDSGFIKVVSGDKDTVDGVIVSLGLVDELHRHKDGGQLYGVIADGAIATGGQIMVISTPAESLKSVLGRSRARALKLPGVKRKDKYTFVRSPSGDFEMHEWSLDLEDDLEDLELVERANPLSTNTIAKLRARKQSPLMTPTRWARFGAGVWGMQGEDAAISALDWGRAGREGLTLTPTGAIYLGLDIGWRLDTTAIVPGEPHGREELVVCPKCLAANRPAVLPDAKTKCRECGRRGEQGWWRFRHVRYGKPRILIPPRDGTSLRRKAIVDAILSWPNAGYEIIGVVFDRNAEGESVAQELEDEHGMRVIMHSQDPSPMADASMGFATAIGAGEVEHPEDDEFTAHVLAAKAKTTSGEKWRLVAPEQNRGARKQGQQERDDVEYVDGAIAGAMLHRVATAPQPPEVDPSHFRIEVL